MKASDYRGAALEMGRHLPENVDTVPRLAAMKFQMGRCQVMLGNIIAAHETVANDGRLSSEGRRDKLRETVASVAPSIASVAAIGANIATALGAWHARIHTVDALDRADAVGAASDAELRSISRSMKGPGERIGAATKDPAFLAALLRGSDIASGITPEVRARLKEHLVQSDPNRARAKAEIEQASDVLGLMRETLTLTRAAASAAGEFSNPAEFQAFFEAAVGDRAAEIEADAVRIVSGMQV